MDQSPIINLKDIESTYSGSRHEPLYLKGINLTVNAGETLGIIGRAGAGKSALLRCIGLLERPLTGLVSIDQKNLTFMASRELCNERRSIGLISSKAEFLNSKSVYNNIALPLKIQGASKEQISKLVLQALTRAELENKDHVFPANLTQLQRIQLDLARALVNNPKILLCDDIFVGIDHRSAETLATLLKKIQQDTKLTIIITTNDAEVIKSLCTNVIIMQQGSIIEKCSVFELFTKPKSDTAKDFIRFTTKQELPWCLRRKIVAQNASEHHAIVRINFSECLAPEEILSNTLEAFVLKMNIIQAYQEVIQAQMINIMLIEIFGDHDVVNDAITFLTNNGLQSEIIGYVPNIN
jgi:D-methionine transport system ATP-binding protein